MNVAAMQYMFNTVVIDEKSSENLLNWLAKLIWLSHFDFFVLEKGDSASGIVSYSLIPYCIVKKLRNPRLYHFSYEWLMLHAINVYALGYFSSCIEVNSQAGSIGQITGF